MQQLKQIAAAVALGIAATSANAAHHEGVDQKALAEGWLEASCGSLDGFVMYVEKHMADDGVWRPDRYVGLGFQVDNEQGDNFGTVMRVTAGTPASEVLKAGDRFVSVNGMDMTWENRDKTTFRGAPGEAVSATIMRGGKEMDVEINRGIIEVENDKATVLANLALADADNWGTGTCEMIDIVEEGNVVYMASEWTDTEAETGIEYTGITVNRFEFNEEGQIVWGSGLGEDRFILEQLGYSISR